jgi:hypothetical protein
MLLNASSFFEDCPELENRLNTSQSPTTTSLLDFSGSSSSLSSEKAHTLPRVASSAPSPQLTSQLRLSSPSFPSTPLNAAAALAASTPKAPFISTPISHASSSPAIQASVILPPRPQSATPHGVGGPRRSSSLKTSGSHLIDHAAKHDGLLPRSNSFMTAMDSYVPPVSYTPSETLQEDIDDAITMFTDSQFSLDASTISLQDAHLVRRRSKSPIKSTTLHLFERSTSGQLMVPKDPNSLALTKHTSHGLETDFEAGLSSSRSLSPSINQPPVFGTARVIEVSADSFEVSIPTTAAVHQSFTRLPSDQPVADASVASESEEVLNGLQTTFI